MNRVFRLVVALKRDEGEWFIHESSSMVTIDRTRDKQHTHLYEVTLR